MVGRSYVELWKQPIYKTAVKLYVETTLPNDACKVGEPHALGI